MRKILIAYWLSCILFFCSACQQNPGTPLAASSPSEPVLEQVAPSWQTHTDPVTLTLASDHHFSGTDSGYPQWGEDPVSRRIIDLTGVKIELQIGADDWAALAAGSHDAAEDTDEQTQQTQSSYMDLLQAAGSVPDLIYISGKADIQRLSDSAYSQPLDVLAAEHCPEFWDSLDPLEILNNQQEDGHVYALPKGYYTQQVYDDPQIPIEVPRTLSLRQDILDKLGASLPTSIEALEALLYQVKDQGQSLGIQHPLRQLNATASPLAEWMGVKRYVYWDPEARSIKTPLRQEAWLPYFLRMNQWYRDGILYLPEQELPWRKGVGDRFDVIGFFSDTTFGSFATAADSLAPDYEALYLMRPKASDDDFAHVLLSTPLTYEGEIRLQAADTAIGYPDDHSDQGALFISTSCVRADRAICFMQYLKSQEGAQLTHWGIQDEHYALDEDGNITYLEAYRYPSEVINDIGLLTSMNRKGLGYWTLMDNSLVTGRLNASPTAYCTNPDLLKIRRMEIEAGVNYKTYAAQNKVPALYFAEPHEGDAGYDEYLALLDTWHHAAWEMVTAPSSQQVESLWAQLMQDLSTAGLDAMESAMTARFADALERYHAAGYFTDIQP